MWDGVGIIVNAIIGSGIFITPKSVLVYVGSPGMALVIWASTGFVCMIGALCYAELALMLPGRTKLVIQDLCRLCTGLDVSKHGDDVTYVAMTSPTLAHFQKSKHVSSFCYWVAYVTSLSRFEPPMSVNIRPLL